MAQRIPSFEEIDKFTNALPEYEFEMAFADLFGMVRPQTYNVEAFRGAVSEYFLFEHKMVGGLTPAQAMAKNDPTLKAWSESEYVRVVADQPFEGDVALMRDVETGEVYEVHGDVITSRPNWVDGSLGCRLCRIGGVYEVVGWVNLHDNAPTTEAYEGEHASLVRDLNRVLGDGGWQESVSSVSYY